MYPLVAGIVLVCHGVTRVHAVAFNVDGMSFNLTNDFTVGTLQMKASDQPTFKCVRVPGPSYLRACSYACQSA